MQKNFVTSKSLYKHEVFLTKFNILPAPSNSASLPDCSLKFPGGKGMKNTMALLSLTFALLFALHTLCSSVIKCPTELMVSTFISQA